jgi:hypothetical protein
MVDM